MNLSDVGHNQDVDHRAKEEEAEKPSESTRLSHWDTGLYVGFLARSSLAVERELRFGKRECADEAAGSAIQFLICRLDLEILV